MTVKQSIAEKRAKWEQEGLTKKEVERRVLQAKLSKKATVAPRASQKNKTAKALSMRENPYLAAILDPESHPVIGVPDAFSRLVHRSKVVMQQSLIFQNGRSTALVRPDITDFLRTTSNTKAVVAVGEVFNQQSHSRLYPSTQGIDDSYTAFKNGDLPESSLLIRKTWASNSYFPTIRGFDYGVDSIQSELRTASDGVQWRGYELPSGASVTINTQWDSITAANMAVRLVYVNAAGTKTVTGTTNFAAVAVEQAITINMPVAGLLVAVEIIRIGASFTDVLMMLNITLSFTTIADDIDTLSSQTLGNNGEYALLLEAGNGNKVSYRISALSVWAYYSGAMTSNGKIAAGMIQKNASGEQTGVCTFETISIAPGCYSGPLNKGAYAYWKPTDEQDLKFSVVGEDTRPKPYIAVAVVANDAEAQNVTLRICAHLEVQTVNQILSPSPSFVDPPLIWDAEAQLATLMTGFENDTHVAKIARVVNRGLGYFGKMAKTAGGIATLLGYPEFGVPASAIGSAFAELN